MDNALEAFLPAIITDIDAEWRVRQGAPPPTVYHYTSATAFRGIVKSGKLWATIATQLNDTTELVHAARLLRSVLAERERASMLLEHRVLYPSLVLNFAYERNDLASTFVASLSGAEDDLSQWCMYGDRSAGISVGFDATALSEIDTAAGESHSIGFFRVRYGDDEQRSFLEWLVSRWEREASVSFARELLRSRDRRLFRATWFGHLAVAAMAVLPRMKSKRFHSENEWRLAHLHNRGQDDCPVSSEGGTKPHVALDLARGTSHLPIVCVWLGAAVSNAESEAAVRQLLDSNGYGHVPIRHSEIPLRGRETRIVL